MEKMMDLLLNAENVRMALMMMFGYCGYVLLKSQTRSSEYSLNKRMDGVENRLDGKIDSLEASLNKRIDGLDKKIDGVEASLNKKMDDLEKRLDEKIDIKLAAFHAQLKANDFAHLNNTIEALTFMLEKNKFLEKEDKEYIDRRLDR
jgi:DNA anti-recombination protein RmuC